MQMAAMMSKSHDEIEMFEGSVGTRAIRDSRHQSKMIEVPVAVQQDANAEPGMTGPGQRRVNLNMNLSEEELNKVRVDQALAEQLLQDQSDRVALPSAVAGDYHTAGAKPTHALDLKVPLKNDGTSNTYNLLKNSSPSKSKPYGLARRRGPPAVHIEDQGRQGTPNPWYHHQKRKLLLRYQKQVLEQHFEDKAAAQSLEDRRRLEQQAKNANKKAKRAVEDGDKAEDSTIPANDGATEPSPGR